MIRFLFHGGTREKKGDGSVRQVGIAHNGAFYFAARNVASDYANGDKRSIKITTAADMVKRINACAANSVASLDVFCHGTPYSLNYSVKENENCGLVTGWMARQGLRAYYSSWDDGVYNFSSDSRYVSDINFKVFTNDARIQIHGCNTARGSMPGNTLVEELSEQIYKAGKKKAYVIGHTDKSNPNIRGSKTTIKQQDYRHGERSIYHNDKLLKITKKKGIIAHDEMQGLIK
ncbi:MAG: hypothetical protein ACI93R_000583 [Flavobacteriales bacterium]|jgi:hypothetical protein